MKKKNVGVRLLSVLMSLTLALGLLPTAALAEGEDTAPETVAAEETVPETPETPEETDAEETAEAQADGETEVPAEPEPPTEYTATISDNDYAKGFYGIEYTLKTTDPKGEGLTGKVELVDNFGEWASVDGNASHTDWIQTDRCKEWKIIADKLKTTALTSILAACTYSTPPGRTRTATP